MFRLDLEGSVARFALVRPRGRWSAATIALSLAACGPGSSETPAAPTGEATAATDDGRIECRIGQASEHERFCTLERQDDLILIRKPDGGFRRLRITDDGRGVVAADGAEAAVVTILDGDRIAVDLGGDTFRLPARIAR